MLGLNVIIAMGIAIILCSLLANRLRLPNHIFLMAGGVLLTLWEPLRNIGLPPEVVLFLFLPALLYWESLTTSSREIRRYIRGILLNGTLLVMATASVVAVICHALGLSWVTSWFIGAAVAPTDATAMSTLGGSLPRGTMTLLRAESLINDGTALAVFALALEYARDNHPGPLPHMSWLFILSFGGGTLIGLAIGWVMFQLRRHLTDPLLNNTATVVTPFLAYLVAEEIGASGVVAVVVCGLFMAQVAPRFISAQTRQISTAFWTLATFILNAGLFVLIGMEIPAAIRELDTTEISRGLIVALAVYLTIIVVRFVFITGAIYVIRVVDRSARQLLPRSTFQGRVLSTAAGFRGGVSLAVALSVPATIGGTASTSRDIVVFVTAGVVVLSLVLQSLVLPTVVRWANLPPDVAEQEELELAQRTAADEAREAIPALAADLNVDDAVLERVVYEYDAHRALTQTMIEEGNESRAARERRQYVSLHLAILARKRGTYVRLRDERVIDDTVLRQLQSRLDLEEVRLIGPSAVD